MCFGKKPKIKEPKITMPTQAPAAPIAEQIPTVVDGAESATATRQKKRQANPNAGLSLFQIQLLPGETTTSSEEPGGGLNG